MSLTLDHVFIITAPDAAVADRFRQLGFIEGNANVHPGQGTANRRFFFDGFTLELLYVSDAVEAANGAGRRLGILDRSRNREACPFGLVVRVADAEAEPTFPNWRYFPDYFDGKLCFHVGENSDQLLEPLCICMPTKLPKLSGIPVDYANPGWRLTAVHIRVPVPKPSDVLAQFAAMDSVHIECGHPHQLNMQFNHGAAKRSENLTPDLPLTLEW